MRAKLHILIYPDANQCYVGDSKIEVTTQLANYIRERWEDVHTDNLLHSISYYATSPLKAGVNPNERFGPDDLIDEDYIIKIWFDAYPNDEDCPHYYYYTHPVPTTIAQEILDTGQAAAPLNTPYQRDLYTREFIAKTIHTHIHSNNTWWQLIQHPTKPLYQPQDPYTLTVWLQADRHINEVISEISRSGLIPTTDPAQQKLFNRWELHFQVPTSFTTPWWEDITPNNNQTIEQNYVLDITIPPDDTHPKTHYRANPIYIAHHYALAQLAPQLDHNALADEYDSHKQVAPSDPLLLVNYGRTVIHTNDLKPTHLSGNPDPNITKHYLAIWHLNEGKG